MSQGAKTRKRKSEHIKIVLNENVQPILSPFHKYVLPYKALPEINLNDIDTTIKFFSKKLSFPFLIASMTGGEEKGKQINKNLAIAAEESNVALALGSMRVTLEKPESLKTFQVRKYCPSIPLFANLGLVQLNYGYGADEINKIIDSIEADGIFLHINHLQEAVQPEGDTNFKGLMNKLEQVIKKVTRPILVKEVGAGIDDKTARRLYDIGVKWIDVSGLGGTSWTVVEGYRREDALGKTFGAVGIPTDEAIKKASIIKGLDIIAGGGLRSGIDIAKSISLGATMAAIATPLLKPALTSSQACIDYVNNLKRELNVAMFCMGVKNIDGLKKITLHEKTSQV